MYKASETKGKKNHEHEHDKKAPNSQGDKGDVPSAGKGHKDKGAT